MKIIDGRMLRAGTLLLCLGMGAAAHAQEQTQAAPAAAADAPAKQLPDPVKQDVEAIATHLLKVQDSDTELACEKAVENARYGMETMLEVGQRNRDGGYLTAADFDRLAAPIKARLVTTTLADCQSAQGTRQAFYRCMTSDYNHVIACAALENDQGAGGK